MQQGLENSFPLWKSVGLHAQELKCLFTPSFHGNVCVLGCLWKLKPNQVEVGRLSKSNSKGDGYEVYFRIEHVLND